MPVPEQAQLRVTATTKHEILSFPTSPRYSPCLLYTIPALRIHQGISATCLATVHQTVARSQLRSPQFTLRPQLATLEVRVLLYHSLTPSRQTAISAQEIPARWWCHGGKVDDIGKRASPSPCSGLGLRLAVAMPKKLIVPFLHHVLCVSRVAGMQELEVC